MGDEEAKIRGRAEHKLLLSKLCKLEGQSHCYQAFVGRKWKYNQQAAAAAGMIIVYMFVENAR